MVGQEELGRRMHVESIRLHRLRAEVPHAEGDDRLGFAANCGLEARGDFFDGWTARPRTPFGRVDRNSCRMLPDNLGE